MADQLTVPLRELRKVEAEVMRLDERVTLLERALVYSTHMQHGTEQYILPKGIALLDAEGVIVTLPSGEKVEAWDRDALGEKGPDHG